MGSITLKNEPASDVPFFTPAQTPPPGSALTPSSAPTLFQPYKSRGLTVQNRFVVAPMCTYSADNGHLTDWHLAHLSQFALGGAGLIFVEATAVEARGRISPEDSGLWLDSQIAPLRRIVDVIHSQGSKAAIQLAHAGRKASTLTPWVGGSANKTVADESVGGWPTDVVAPSSIPYDASFPTPKSMTAKDIERIVGAFAQSARRAVDAGFDAVELQACHGYLLSQSLSPITNVSPMSLFHHVPYIDNHSLRNEQTNTAEAMRTAHVFCVTSSPPSAPSCPRTCRFGCASRPQSGWNTLARPRGTCHRPCALPGSFPLWASTCST